MLKALTYHTNLTYFKGCFVFLPQGVNKHNGETVAVKTFNQLSHMRPQEVQGGYSVRAAVSLVGVNRDISQQGALFGSALVQYLVLERTHPTE